MSDDSKPILVLGIGNILMGDDGAGVHLARALLERVTELPEGTVILDGGTLGLELLDDVEDAGALIVLDAVNLGAEPGTLCVLRGDEISAVFGTHLSPHQVGVADLLAAARLLGILPAKVSLVGLQPRDTGFSLDLSDVVASAMWQGLEAAMAEAWAMHREATYA